MCSFFSFISVGEDMFYFDRQDRILLNQTRGIWYDKYNNEYEYGVMPDSHTSIFQFKVPRRLKEEEIIRWEYDPNNDSLEIDSGSAHAERFQFFKDKVRKLFEGAEITPVLYGSSREIVPRNIIKSMEELERKHIDMNYASKINTLEDFAQTHSYDIIQFINSYNREGDEIMGIGSLSNEELYHWAKSIKLSEDFPCRSLLGMNMDEKLLRYYYSVIELTGGQLGRWFNWGFLIGYDSSTGSLYVKHKYLGSFNMSLTTEVKIFNLPKEPTEEEVEQSNEVYFEDYR